VVAGVLTVMRGNALGEALQQVRHLVELGHGSRSLSSDAGPVLG
jgi:hypothetical protein